MINTIKGDLIKLAQEGHFDVIAHGCNCFCTMRSGIAPQMAKAFEAHQTPLEDTYYKGDINKLGQIDWFIPDDYPKLIVINAYTQYNYGNEPNTVYLDYDALTLCMRKINHMFKGKHVGLPQIGAGKAKGDWSKILHIIETELKDCTVTIVEYEI